METLEHTYCKNTKDNLKRYQETGWIHVEKLDEKDGEFIIASRVITGKEICFVISKNSNLLNHLMVYSNLRLIEDAKEDIEYDRIASLVFGEFSIHGLDKMNKISIPADNNDTKKYTLNNVITMLEHILSFQKPANQWSISNTLEVNTMVDELKKFGFYVNPQGKNIEGK